MRNTYIIAYDITENKRRTKAHKILKGYGEALQYSVFQCQLAPAERVQLQTALWDVINLAKDRVVLLDLGPQQGRAPYAIETWGKPLEEPRPVNQAVII